MTNDHNKEKDAVTGVETTGHEWDGIKELNNPAPRWWLWVFYVSIIWSIGYWVVYPTWPTLSGHTKGNAEWTQYKQLEEQQQEITVRKAKYLQQFRNSSFKAVMKNPELYAFAVAGGKSAFKDNCATCHGTGGAGAKGYPNLNDDDWLWGGTHEDIYTTIRHGVRADDDDTRESQMPNFGKDDMLSRDAIGDVADYVISLSKGGTYPEQGAALFQEQCAACHSDDGKGNREFGAPNLADAIWFYGSKKEELIAQIWQPKHGMMPHWSERLDDDTIRQLAVYVHSLGGGE